MKNRSILISTSFFVGFFLLQSYGAFAKCESQGNPSFNISAGFGMDVYYLSDGGNCGLGYTSGGGTMFTKASVKSSPTHGNIKQDKQFHFVYSPAKNYSGEDKFTINLCGSYQGKESCIDNNYTVKVQRK
jgi:hypothetical protein